GVGRCRRSGGRLAARAHFVIWLMAFAADGDELPKELVANVVIGQMMNLNRPHLSAAFTDAAGAMHDEPLPLFPLVGLQICGVPLPPFFSPAARLTHARRLAVAGPNHPRALVLAGAHRSRSGQNGT